MIPRVEDFQLVTDQWVLSISLNFKLRKGFEPREIACKDCDGRGHTGGGFRGPDIEECLWCHGSGKRMDYSHITEPKPEVPIELVNCLKSAYGQYLRDKAVIDKEDEAYPVCGI